MKTAIYHGIGQPFEIQEIAIEPEGDQAIIRTEACTLCSSDLHTVTGRRTSPTPGVLGHEAIGHVLQLPKTWQLLDTAENTIEIGQRIVWGVAANCGDCIFCQNDIPQKCVKLLKYGHCIHRPDTIPKGGLSELVEIVKGTPVTKLSNEIPAGMACLAACAGATVAAAVRLCGKFNARSVLVLGGGVLGVIACRMAKKAGAANVICIEPDAHRRQRAILFGADMVVDPTDVHTESIIKSICNEGHGADIAMEFSGSNAAFETGLRVLRTGGHFLLAGAVFPAGKVAVEPEQIIRRMLTIQGLHNYAPVDLQSAVAFLEDEFKFSPQLWAGLTGQTFELTEIDSAFAWAAKNPGVRAVISMVGDKGE